MERELRPDATGIDSHISNYDLAYSAMCIWELFTEAACVEASRPEAMTDFQKTLRGISSNGGSHAARDACALIAGATETAWRIADKAYGGDLPIAFDWEFVPLFIEQAIKPGYTLRAGFTLKDNWREIAYLIGYNELVHYRLCIKGQEEYEDATIPVTVALD